MLRGIINTDRGKQCDPCGRGWGQVATVTESLLEEEQALRESVNLKKNVKT